MRIDMRLTKRQNEVLDLAIGGAGDREISARMGIAPFAVSKYFREICRRLEYSSRDELMVALAEDPNLLGTHMSKSGSLGSDLDMLIIGYMSDGYGEEDVAKILDVPWRRIHFRLQRLRLLFGYRNTTHAVAGVLWSMWNQGKVWTGNGWVTDEN